MKKMIVIIGFLLLMVSFAYAESDLNDGLKGVFDMSLGYSDVLGNLDDMNYTDTTTATTGGFQNLGYWEVDADTDILDAKPIYDNEFTTDYMSASFWVYVNSWSDSIYGTTILLAGYGSGGGDTRYGILLDSVSHDIKALWAADAYATSSTMPLNEWRHFVITTNGTGASNTYKLFMNGEQNYTNTQAFNTQTTWLRISFMSSSIADYDTRGKISNLVLYNRTLTAEEVALLYADGAGSFYPFSITNSNIDIRLLNMSYQNFTDVYEDNDFFISANYSINGETQITGVCNFTAVNISVDFSYDSASNKSLNASSKDLSVILSESPTNLLEDIIQFKACSKLIPQDFNVLVNGAIHQTILSTQIPKCTSGTFSYLNRTTLYSGQTAINLTLSCPSCDDANKQIRIVSDSSDELLHYIRKFSSHTEDMSYNSSLGLYVYSSYPYQFRDPGYGNITVLCNDTRSSQLFSILNRNLTANILEIDDTTYTPGMVIESTNSTDIIIGVSGDVIGFLQFNVTNSTGSVIKSTSNQYMSLSNLELTKNGYYNISISAKDISGNEIRKTGYFYINDSVIPSMTWNYPITNGTLIANGSTHTINISLFDVNLFGYNMTVIDPNGTVYSNDLGSGLSPPTYTYTKAVLFNQPGNWTIDAFVSDSHTLNDIGIYEYEKTGDMLNFIFDDKNVKISYMGIYTVDDIKVTKSFDKYSFEYVMPSIITKDTVRHVFRLECSNSYYIHDSEYPAHFVCYDALKWVDFDTDSLIDYNIYTCGKDCYTIELFTKPDKNLIFNSIGGLNIIHETKYVSVTTSPLPSAAVPPFDFYFKTMECPIDSIQSVMLFAFLFVIIGVFFYMSKFVLRIPFMSLLTCVAGMFYFFTLIACHQAVGIIGIAFCLVTAVYEIMG